MAKGRKPLTPREQWENVCTALAEDSLKDAMPDDERNPEAVERIRKKLDDAIKSDVESTLKTVVEDTRRAAARGSSGEKTR